MAKIFVLIILLLTAILISAQETQKSIEIFPISKYCLGCICEVATGCNGFTECHNGYCGPFALSINYWIDADRIVSSIWNSPSSTNSGLLCLGDIDCATRVVIRYMEKFAQDCNGDDKIDCQDYISLHFFGKQNCTQPLDNYRKDVFNTCMKNMEARRLPVVLKQTK